MLALAKMEKLPRGIEGVKGKRQPSCVVSNGRKGERGGVVERDRFHIVEPTENKNKIKPYHPAFAAFNSAPAEKRRSVYGILTHISEEDAFWYERKAQQLPVNFYRTLGWFKNGRENQQTVAHPNRLPACCGGSLDEKDGKTKAHRWFGPGPDDFKFIECPGRQCEFSIRKSDDDKPPCGPSLDFMFQLIWKDEFSSLPSVTARYTSHGWDTLEYFIGFFKEIATAVTALGIEHPVLYGFPFMMSLAEKTKPSKRWNWPIVTITPMISPLEFFYAQIEKRKQLKDMAAQIPAVITIREEMEIRPTVYLMDEAGPLHIGKQSQNGTAVVTVEPEIVPDGENDQKRATMPPERFSQPATNLQSSEVEKVIPGKTGKAVDTKKEASPTSENGHISEKQVSTIIELVDEGWNQKFFAAWMNGVHRIERVEDLAAENYDKFIASLKKQIAGMKKR